MVRAIVVPLIFQPSSEVIDRPKIQQRFTEGFELVDGESVNFCEGKIGDGSNFAGQQSEDARSSGFNQSFLRSPFPSGLLNLGLEFLDLLNRESGGLSDRLHWHIHSEHIESDRPGRFLYPFFFKL